MLIPNQPTLSTACATTGCVEATLTDEGVQVRDTKPGGAAVLVPVVAFRSFVDARKTEVLDG